MGSFNDFILNLLGFHTAPSHYTRADFLGQQPQPRNYDVMAGADTRELEQRKTLPRNIQLAILNQGTK